MGFSLFNLHIGSSPSKLSTQQSLRLASDMLDEVLAIVPDIHITLENSTGFGSQLGAELSDIAQIMCYSHFRERIGFALNTSHAFAYGYDFMSFEQYEQFIEHIELIIGLKHLKLMFLNDSKSGFGSCLDIHENLGHGKIPLKSLGYFLSDKRLKRVPVILETPNPALWKKEIAWTKNALPNLTKKSDANV